MLGLSTADEAPHRRHGKVDVVVHIDRAACDDDQLCIGEPLLGEPILQLPQGALGDGVCLGRHVAVGRSGREHDGPFTGELVEECPVRGGGRGDRRPADLIQDLPGGEPVSRDRAHRQFVDRQDRRTIEVGDAQGVAVRCARDSHAQLALARAVHGHSAPGERQQHVATERLQHHRMQRCVKERRMQGEPVRALLLGQRHLGVDVVAVVPGGTQALERGPVFVAAVGQPVVRLADVDRGAHWRPGFRRFSGLGCGENAAGVQGPWRFAVVGLRVDGHLAACTEGYLDAHAAPARQDQRLVQVEFRDLVIARLAARVQDQFEQRAARDQRRAEHGMVGQPRLGRAGKPAGEYGAPTVGQLDRGTEQRVVPAGGGRVDPEPPVLERVSGQVDPPSAAGERGGPVDVCSAHIRGRERGQQCLGFGPVAPQHGGECGSLGEAVFSGGG